MMAGRKFTPTEDATLRRNYRRRGSAWCAEKLQRSRSGVYQRAVMLGLAERRLIASDSAISEAITRWHPDGWSDSEICEALGRSIGCAVNRHRVGIIRRGMGLPSNGCSERQRARTAAKTAEQLAASGLPTLAELRREKWNEWKRSLGWPEDLTVRAVQALECFYRFGPMTRVELCHKMGVSPRKRTAPTSNAPGGTVLGELQRAGLVSRLRKAVKVPGELQLHCEGSTGRRRLNHKWIDLYFLNPGVKPNGRDAKAV